MVTATHVVDELRMENFRKLFGLVKSTNRVIVIGMIHVNALPGTPKHSMSIDEIVEKTCKEAQVYKRHKLDGVLVENMHDVPYLRGSVGPEIVSGMTIICSEVKNEIGSMPMGVQILAAANKEALAVAHCTGAQFIRVEGFVYSHIADEGWIDSSAGDILRYRRYIGADNTLIFTDIKKKHSSHAITEDISIQESAQAAEFFGSDGVIITGKHTGHPTSLTDIIQTKESVSLPVIVGSGVTADNIHKYLKSDAVIIGSHFKREGLWYNTLDDRCVTLFMHALNKCNGNYGI